MCDMTTHVNMARATVVLLVVFITPVLFNQPSHHKLWECRKPAQVCGLKYKTNKAEDDPTCRHFTPWKVKAFTEFLKQYHDLISWGGSWFTSLIAATHSVFKGSLLTSSLQCIWARQNENWSKMKRCSHYLEGSRTKPKGLRQAGGSQNTWRRSYTQAGWQKKHKAGKKRKWHSIQKAIWQRGKCWLGSTLYWILEAMTNEEQVCGAEVRWWKQ